MPHSCVTDDMEHELTWSSGLPLDETLALCAGVKESTRPRPTLHSLRPLREFSGYWRLVRRLSSLFFFSSRKPEHLRRLCKAHEFGDGGSNDVSFPLTQLTLPRWPHLIHGSHFYSGLDGVDPFGQRYQALTDGWTDGLLHT